MVCSQGKLLSRSRLKVARGLRRSCFTVARGLCACKTTPPEPLTANSRGLLRYKCRSQKTLATVKLLLRRPLATVKLLHQRPLATFKRLHERNFSWLFGLKWHCTNILVIETYFKIRSRIVIKIRHNWYSWWCSSQEPTITINSQLFQDSFQIYSMLFI